MPLGLRVVDVEVIPDLAGATEPVEAWLILATADEAKAARQRIGELRHSAVLLLTEAGYPAADLRSFGLNVTCVPEIEARGGRFAFFR